MAEPPAAVAVRCRDVLPYDLGVVGWVLYHRAFRCRWRVAGGDLAFDQWRLPFHSVSSGLRGVTTVGDDLEGYLEKAPLRGFGDGNGTETCQSASTAWSSSRSLKIATSSLFVSISSSVNPGSGLEC